MQLEGHHPVNNITEIRRVCTNYKTRRKEKGINIKKNNLAMIGFPGSLLFLLYTDNYYELFFEILFALLNGREPV
jgi:hypothetical protein